MNVPVVPSSVIPKTIRTSFWPAALALLVFALAVTAFAPRAAAQDAAAGVKAGVKAGGKAWPPRSYTLPDPLVTAAGVKVKTAREWQEQRRAEVLELFREHSFGRSPGRPEGLSFNVIEEDALALNGKATRREVDISFPGARGTFTFRLLIYLPNSAKKPVPVFLLLNHRGDVHALVNQPFFPVDQIIARGLRRRWHHAGPAFPGQGRHVSRRCPRIHRWTGGTFAGRLADHCGLGVERPSRHGLF